MSSCDNDKIDQYVKILENTFRGEQRNITIAALWIYLGHTMADHWSYEKCLEWLDKMKHMFSVARITR